MKLTLLGTGLPMPNPHRKGPSQAITFGEETVLIDCGPGAVHRLVEMGTMPSQIHRVFLTHQHADHYLDLDYFILIRWLSGVDAPLEIYGPPGIQRMVETLMEAHAFDYAERIKSTGTDRGLPTFSFQEYDPGPICEINGAKVKAFNIDHLPNNLSFGFRFDDKDTSIVLSGDTAPCENVIRYAHKADLLVHECVDARKSNLAKSSLWKSPEDRIAHMSRIHTFPDALGEVAREADPKKLVTTHMVPATVPAELKEQIADNFNGPIVIGEDLLDFDLAD